MSGSKLEIDWELVVGVPLAVAWLYRNGVTMRTLVRLALIVVIYNHGGKLLADDDDPTNGVKFIGLIAALLFLAFGIQPTIQFPSRAWQYLRTLTLARLLADVTPVLVVTAVAFVSVLLPVGLILVVGHYGTNPALYTFLVFSALLYWNRFQRKAVVGASIAIAFALATSWCASIYPLLETCTYLLTAGVGCIVYGMFFLPAEGDNGLKTHPG